METSVKQNHPVFTVKEAADYLRLSEMTILRLAQKGTIPGSKIGRQWRFSREVLINLVNDREIMRRVDLRK